MTNEIKGKEKTERKTKEKFGYEKNFRNEDKMTKKRTQNELRETRKPRRKLVNENIENNELENMSVSSVQKEREILKKENKKTNTKSNTRLNTKSMNNSRDVKESKQSRKVKKKKTKKYLSHLYQAFTHFIAPR